MVVSVLGTIRRKDLLFMQYEALPHFAIVVREWLNAEFPGKWMGHRGSHEWPIGQPQLLT